MVTQRTNSGKARSVLGLVIVAIGVLALAPKFLVIIPLLSGTLQEVVLDVFNALPSIGLGALHAGESLAFEPSAFFAGALRILVSFWPLLLVAAGTGLLRNDSGVWPRNPKETPVSSTGSGS